MENLWNGFKMPDESKDWLVLSLKWSTGDYLCWYKPEGAGYTTNLIHAGRYTRAEANAQTVPGVTLPVFADDAFQMGHRLLVIPNNTSTKIDFASAVGLSYES